MQFSAQTQAAPSFLTPVPFRFRNEGKQEYTRRNLIKSNQNQDYIYYAPIDLEPQTDVRLCSKSIGKW